MKNYYERNPRNYSLLSDEYEFSMSNVYIQNGFKDTEVVFDAFFRKIPNGGGYALMAGLDKIIDYIKNLKFTDREIEYFRSLGYSEEMLEYFKNFKFTGSISAIPDGTPIFPNEPILTVKAPFVEAQIIETAILAMLNGSIEHATAARRIVEATPKNVKIMEFGPRRADGTEAAIDTSIYALMAGCHAISNSMVANMLGIKAVGTMAHSFIEAYDSELEAFMDYAKYYPNNCILLVDTYDTLNSGVVNAIKTFKHMKENGISTDHIGIRIDSGDLAYLSKEARKMLDEAGFENATICLSNSLNAQTIESLVQQGAKFDSIGVGDNISKPEGRLGAVYKLVAVYKDNQEVPKIKLSNDVIKIVNPGHKKLYRAYDKNTGYAIADVMSRIDEEINQRDLTIVSLNGYKKSSVLEDYELIPLQKPIFIDGEYVYDEPSYEEKRKYCEEQMQTIYPEVRRILNPHEYYVDGTNAYAQFKEQMISDVKDQVKLLRQKR